MSDDASLTDFVGDDGGDEGVADDAADGSASPDDGSSDAADADERVPPASVEAAEPTADWSPDGAECSACGAVVAHRWESDDGLVCPDCKEW